MLTTKQSKQETSNGFEPEVLARLQDLPPGQAGITILQMLLGGQRTEFHSVDIGRAPKGNAKIILPEDMTYDEGIKWLQRKRDAELKEVAVQEMITGFPLDAARALQLAVQDRYGYQELKTIPGGFFEPDRPPLFITAPIDAKGSVEEIFVGRFKVPQIDGYLETYPDGNNALVLGGIVKQKSLPEVKAIAALTRQYLAERSLYKGRAVKIDFAKVLGKGMVMPEFWDTTKGSEELLLNKDVTAQVRAALWNTIIYTDRCRALGIPLKRGLLFEGEYGTGKTLCANKTARIATEFGWTFIYVDAVHLSVAYEFAKRYQPAIVFAEDVDRAAKDNEDFVGQLSNVLDGVDSKRAEVILIFTTNHVSNIPGVLLRPGRIDAAIHFSTPDADTAAKLVEHYAIDISTGRSLLDPSCNAEAIGTKLAGKIPAIIREVVERAKLHAIDREPLLIQTDDIIYTAELMEHHAKLCQPPVVAPSTAEVLATSLQRLTGTAVEEMLTEKGVI